MNRSATSLGRLATGTGVVAIALMLLTAVLGPSAAEVPLPPGRWPVAFSLHPSPWVVTGLSLAAVLCSGAAVLAALTALERGWAPNPRVLLIGAFVAVGLLVAVPPIGSADVLDYAAYGHAVDRGIDPYRVPPRAMVGDPFANAVEAPWRGVTSAYGPVATAEQNAVVELSGDHQRMAVALLDLVHGLAFALSAWLLYRLARTDGGRRRAVLLFGLNPLLLYAVVAGGHIDSLAILGIAAAYALLRRSPLLAGLAGGVALLVKLTGALPLAAWAVALRRSPRRVAALAAGAACVFGAGYAIVGFSAFGQARRASRYASPATPWRAVRTIHVLVGDHAAATLVSVGAAMLGLVVIAVLHRHLPVDLVVGDTPGLARAALAWTLGWVLTAPYVLSWYDLLPWVFITLVAASRYDKVLLLHTATLAAVYIPGRASQAVHMPHALLVLTNGARFGVAPVIGACLIVVAVRPQLVGRLDRRVAAA